MRIAQVGSPLDANENHLMQQILCAVLHPDQGAHDGHAVRRAGPQNREGLIDGQ
jgi:hypothetical protein